ncbi:MAG: S41 family peptidase [Spirochaetes bacterium]|nr:S41 family peptidase [Spirochaetota bacterium]
MKRKIKLLILPIVFLFSACDLFLGLESNLSPPEVLKSLWNDFNNIHANLDLRMSNNTKYNSWYDVYNNKSDGYAYKVSSGTSQEELFDICGKMLGQLNDPHVGLYAPGGRSYSSYSGSGENFSVKTIREKYLKGEGDSGYKNFLYGKFELNSDIGYIYISSFINIDPETKDQEWGRAIDKITSSLANTKALVLDVRYNTGGDIYVMEYIAAYFASESKDYIKARVKTGPEPNDLSAPITYTVKSIKKASDNQHGYTKPIILLTNKDTVSAAEWFTMALRTQNHVKHVGTTTRGAFSARNDRFMINGWHYSISPERVTDINGKTYEGIGIFPEKEIRNTTSQTDDQLIYAFECAKELAGI